jgi:hypothetical protein
MKVQDQSDNQRVEKLMDYLKYRGCHVNVIARYVAEQPPVIKPDRDLSQCREEDELMLKEEEAPSKEAKPRTTR